MLGCMAQLAPFGPIASTSASQPAGNPPAQVASAPSAKALFKATDLSVVLVADSTWIEAVVHPEPRRADWACRQVLRLHTPLAACADPLYPSTPRMQRADAGYAGSPAVAAHRAALSPLWHAAGAAASQSALTGLKALVHAVMGRHAAPLLQSAVGAAGMFGVRSNARAASSSPGRSTVPLNALMPRRPTPWARKPSAAVQPL